MQLPGQKSPWSSTGFTSKQRKGLSSSGRLRKLRTAFARAVWGGGATAAARSLHAFGQLGDHLGSYSSFSRIRRIRKEISVAVLILISTSSGEQEMPSSRKVLQAGVAQIQEAWGKRSMPISEKGSRNISCDRKAARTCFRSASLRRRSELRTSFLRHLLVIWISCGFRLAIFSR